MQLSNSAFRQELLQQIENNFGVINCIIIIFLTSTQILLKLVFFSEPASYKATLTAKFAMYFQVMQIGKSFVSS